MSDINKDISFYLSNDNVNIIHGSILGVTLGVLMFSFYKSDYTPPRVTKVKSNIYNKKS